MSRVSSFRALAKRLMPADEATSVSVIEVDADWSLGPLDIAHASRVVMWGREAALDGRLGLLAFAARREWGLRRFRRRLPTGLEIRGVHRLPPTRTAVSRDFGLRSALRGGLLVEAASRPYPWRIVDAVLAAAGAAPAVDLDPRVGSSGGLILQVMVDAGQPAVLRMADPRSWGDPRRLDGLLDVIDRVSVAPRQLASGVDAGVSWSTESRLPGAPPRRVWPSLARSAARLCAGFPRSDGPPSATARDLEAIGRLLPSREGVLEGVAISVSRGVEDVTGVLRHGDFWVGNLLVLGSQITGVVDWDAADPSGVPGADLLQLTATDGRRRARQGLGDSFLRRPWTDDAFATAAAEYWPAVGIRPSPAMLESVGVAWWASEVRGTLERLPHRRTDDAWLDANLDRVLRELA